MIDKRSRYRTTPTTEVRDGDGRRARLLELRETPHPSGFFHTTPRVGERLDHLAQTYFRDPTRFWRICEAAVELDPFDVVRPGEPVLIPPDE